ncbi:orotate phosphoribosyltransferase [Chitinivibrio alkaliphilus]|uniref:Orotate phosphoribosyltransferase n=1 Tax=Chitinivibrio alkaliphilus ACht1 TaxID=1313304 RepID=U7D7U5_9BACT|nr:orotate phosphoribosyltransferase [Chitinivibrio alkaliphilus]ERP39025.1 orotate phosphoribosyltransferase [Chitinivibrio alkaliphilus ACht1]
MEAYKKEFIEFMVRAGVLTFGDFTTKSGRKTPYFINTGKYSTAEEIQKLGAFYARAIAAEYGTDEAFVLFGPAYKGIPLVVTTAVAMHHAGQEASFCFNRKEIKDHGEGGSLVGHSLKPNDPVLIVEDVTTAGTSIYETVPLLRSAAPISLRGLIVSVDRMEKGSRGVTAFEELRQEFHMETRAIVTIEEIVSYLHNRVIDGTIYINDDMKERIAEYLRMYGA